MMEHGQVRERLSAYIDHELSAAESLELEAHLKGCSSCTGELEAIRALVRRAGELPESVEPPRDLWPGLRDRLGLEEPREDSGWRRFWFPAWSASAQLAAAAAAAIVVAGALWIWNSERSPRRDPPVPAPVAGTETGVPPDMAVVTSSGESRPGGVAQMIWALEEESLGAGRALMASMRGGPEAMSPEGLQAIDSSLRALDLAIEESVVALNRDPNNPHLLQRVTGYYRQRLSLLKMATRIANQA